MGFTAGVHDSRVYNHTPLYLNLTAEIKPMLLDLICFHHTQARRPECSNLSIPRAQVEHVLKAQFPSPHKLPIQIRENALAGHLQVTYMFWASRSNYAVAGTCLPRHAKLRVILPS